MAEQIRTAQRVCLSTDAVELTLPSDEKNLLLVRLTVAGILANVTGDPDLVDDIKTAVAEACYCLMHQSCAYSRLKLTFSHLGNAVHIDIAGLEPMSDYVDDGYDFVQISLCILSSMVDGVDVRTRNDGGIAAFHLSQAVE